MKKGGYVMNARFGIVTLVLIMVIAFFAKGIVMSKDGDSRAKENAYFAVLEEQYRKDMKTILNDNGLNNCGVTMTRVTELDGMREYTVRLHHEKLNRADESRKADLLRELKALEFEGECCIFIYQM